MGKRILGGANRAGHGRGDGENGAASRGGDREGMQAWPPEAVKGDATLRGGGRVGHWFLLIWLYQANFLHSGFEIRKRLKSFRRYFFKTREWFTGQYPVPDSGVVEAEYFLPDGTLIQYVAKAANRTTFER